MDLDVTDEAIGIREMDEGLIVHVVAGDDDPALGDRPAEHPRPDFQLDRADPLATAVVGDPGVVSEPEDPGLLVEEVGHGAVGPEEAGCLVDGTPEDGVDIRRLPKLGRARGRGL